MSDVPVQPQPVKPWEGSEEPSEFGGSPSQAAAARTRSAGDRLTNLRRTGSEDVAVVSDAAADAYWEGLEP